MSTKLIDIAYKVFKQEINAQSEAKPWKFETIIEVIAQNHIPRLSVEDLKTKLGDIYTSLIQDTRFILTRNNLWTLRELLTLDEIKEISNAMYEVGLYKDQDKEFDEDPEKIKNKNATGLGVEHIVDDEESEEESIYDFIVEEDEESDEFAPKKHIDNEDSELKDDEEEEEE